MKKLMDKVERLLFGATAEEQVEMRMELARLVAERAVDERMARLAAALAADDDEDGDGDESEGRVTA